jgi:hypothetical protein
MFCFYALVTCVPQLVLVALQDWPVISEYIMYWQSE